MNIVGVFKESALAIKRHTALVAPSVMSILVVALIFELSFRSNVSPVTVPGAESLPEVKDNMGRIILTIMVNVFFQILSQTVTVAMAEDATKTGGCSVRAGFYAVYPKILDILLTAVALILPPAVFISMARALPSMGALLHLAALVAGMGFAFYFMFVVAALAVDNLNAQGAMSRSFTVVRQNTQTAIRLFLSVAAMWFIVAVASIALSYIPIVGYPVYIAVSSFFMTFVTISFLISYRTLGGGATPRVNGDVPPPSLPGA
jgi:hypothetical protein